MRNRYGGQFGVGGNIQWLRTADFPYFARTKPNDLVCGMKNEGVSMKRLLMGLMLLYEKTA